MTQFLILAFFNTSKKNTKISSTSMVSSVKFSTINIQNCVELLPFIIKTTIWGRGFSSVIPPPASQAQGLEFNPPYQKQKTKQKKNCHTKCIFFFYNAKIQIHILKYYRLFIGSPCLCGFAFSPSAH